jgi:hypothetical protein
MIEEPHNRVYRKEFMVLYQPEAKDEAYSLDLDGGMKRHDIGAFIDKDDGREYYCLRTLRRRKMQRRTQVFY